METQVLRLKAKGESKIHYRAFIWQMLKLILLYASLWAKRLENTWWHVIDRHVHLWVPTRKSPFSLFLKNVSTYKYHWAQTADLWNIKYHLFYFQRWILKVKSVSIFKNKRKVWYSRLFGKVAMLSGHYGHFHLLKLCGCHWPVVKWATYSQSKSSG